jgi:hypothetical protein
MVSRSVLCLLVASQQCQCWLTALFSWLSCIALHWTEHWLTDRPTDLLSSLSIPFIVMSPVAKAVEYLWMTSVFFISQFVSWTLHREWDVHWPGDMIPSYSTPATEYCDGRVVPLIIVDSGSHRTIAICNTVLRLWWHSPITIVPSTHWALNWTNQELTSLWHSTVILTGSSLSVTCGSTLLTALDWLLTLYSISWGRLSSDQREITSLQGSLHMSPIRLPREQLIPGHYRRNAYKGWFLRKRA